MVRAILCMVCFNIQVTTPCAVHISQFLAVNNDKPMKRSLVCITPSLYAHL